MPAPSDDRHVLLIHGGLAESMDAERFWVRPGIVNALAQAGFVVAAPDRVRRRAAFAPDVGLAA